MEKYKKLNSKGRIKYAKKMVKRKTIIKYQHRIARAMVGTTHFSGTTGRYQTPVSIKIKRKWFKKYVISVVYANSRHTSTYYIRYNKLLKIVADQFWIWKT